MDLYWIRNQYVLNTRYWERHAKSENVDLPSLQEETNTSITNTSIDAAPGSCGGTKPKISTHHTSHAHTLPHQIVAGGIPTASFSSAPCRAQHTQSTDHIQ